METALSVLTWEPGPSRTTTYLLNKRRTYFGLLLMQPFLAKYRCHTVQKAGAAFLSAFRSGDGASAVLLLRLEYNGETFIQYLNCCL